MLSAALVLLVFLGLTGWVLDRAFRDSAESALQGRLEGQLFGLLGVAEYIPGKGLQIASDPPEARFSQTGSGLIAQSIDASGKYVWQSDSSLGLSLPDLPKLNIDVSRFHRISIDGEDWFSYEYGLSWVDNHDQEHEYTFRITETPVAYTTQVNSFRQTMITWFTLVAIMLLIVQAMILRWGLSPLRRIEHELQDVESGITEKLAEDYPRELKGLAANLNMLIRNERRHLERYRHTLADLAHSLKTPLAVLRGAASTDSKDDNLGALVDEQVNGMTDLVEYQLQKAAAAGTTSLARGISIDEHAQRIIDSLHKVYQDKDITIDVEIAEDAVFYGESGDLMEVLGNLLDNACKWCAGRVSLTVSALSDHEWRKGTYLCVEDDGPGIAQDQIDSVQKRGERGDSQVPGHGIGLAVVSEIVHAYGGEVDITPSDLGGARVCLSIEY